MNENKMTLSLRLQAVAEFVAKGSVPVDIGTDHGYVPLYLVENGCCPRAIAADINEGPLKRAKEHIAAAGLEDRIETVLSDGLKNIELSDKEASYTLILAGMGGPLMSRILSDDPRKCSEFRHFVFEPQSEVEQFRRCLSELGILITDETMVWEDRKFYPIIRAVVDGDIRVKSSGDRLTIEHRYGPVLLRRNHPVLKEYLKKERQQKLAILDKIESATGDEATHAARIEEIKEDLRINRYAQEQMGGGLYGYS